MNKLSLVEKRMWPPESLLAEDVLEKIYAGVSENETSVAEFWIKTRLIMGEVKGPEDYFVASRLLGNNFPLYVDYDYIFNSVELATGVAAAPAYYRNGTGAMFYGGLGFLMATQLVKSVDEVGLEWAAPETIADSLLSGSSRRAYDDRIHCLNESGAKSIFPEIPALEIAYSALEDSNLLGGQEHLALSPELQEGKVFFLTICYMTCAAPSHSNPVTTDCNKLARNSVHFAKVYGCAKGSRMNPEKKCSFFG
ncbi:endothelin-converting enzyme 2-like [Dermacentor variabilis]|uniref:endothelin-converting enzyme 2-like n=1 Tax=Dermacentor variabilis TaxID=34621 RepID=UPI003F5B013A